MKTLRITPLNIVMAGLLTWMFWQLLVDAVLGFRMVWVTILLVILVAADQLFRILVRDLRRIWLIEVGFLLLVVSVYWIVRSI